MATKKKSDNQPIPPPADPVPAGANLPFAVRRELEEITRLTGKVFDLSAPLADLEAICNSANRPAGAWRDRWTE